jgi:hypothetical protein
LCPTINWNHRSLLDSIETKVLKDSVSCTGRRSRQETDRLDVQQVDGLHFLQKRHDYASPIVCVGQESSFSPIHQQDLHRQGT